MQPIYLIELDSLKAEKLREKSKPISLYPIKQKDRFYLSTNSLKALRKEKIRFKIIQKRNFQNLPVKIIYPLQSSLFDAPHSEAIEEIAAYAVSKQKERKKTYIFYLGRMKSPPKGSLILDRPGGKRSYCWKIFSKPKKIKEFRTSFPKMIARMKDLNTKVVLSFGGGGLRLFAHPALMKFLELLFTPKETRKQVGEIF